MDDNNSQAIISSGEEDRDMGSELVDSGSAPQLVMPSIKMPSRRPFTEKGKNMGRLKVLIAGDSGVVTLFGVMTELTYCRCRQDFFDQSDCTKLRRYRSRRSSFHYASSGSRNTAEELKVQVKKWERGSAEHITDHGGIRKHKGISRLVV